jgi:hypothetical protein
MDVIDDYELTKKGLTIPRHLLENDVKESNQLIRSESICKEWNKRFS